MPPPRASKNFQQRQPITTTLRNICASYPTDTCLRELLQNADDAGATEIEYVLDTTSYFDRPLLHPDLGDYHGPAILVRNNSLFTDKDFGSLSSVGDSSKRDDPASTGKFGQGFNSVYHWTDGPWIYSRSWLLILDPHHSWSSETEKPGGPAWDVIENRDSVEIQNALKTLHAFDIDCGDEYKGTIIRIPLRTEGQAVSSKIVNKAITIQKIQEALEDFDKEIRDGALLFLKHVRSVKIRVDSTTISTIEILEHNTQHTRARKQLPQNFKTLYDPKAPNDGKDVSCIFELDIKYESRALSKTISYLVQHSMTRSCGDEVLDLWAHEQKLFPWVAVAAPLGQVAENFGSSGGLFSTLRLPPHTGQPVHIHGLFAIPPDRANLDRQAEAVQWNQWLFEHCVATAWAQLLWYRNCISWNAEKFSLWPRADLADNGLWANLDAWVIDHVISKRLPVWNVIGGCCVEFDQALFAMKNAESAEYGEVLAHIQLPAVILEEALFRKVEQAAARQAKELKLMSPSKVCDFLRGQCPADLNRDVASPLLEYCLLDLIKGDLKINPQTLYQDVAAFQLWPTIDGNIHTAGNLLLPRDEEEMNLFYDATKRISLTLDLNALTLKVVSQLLRDVGHLGTVMRYRTLLDLVADWDDLYPVTPQPHNTNGLAQRSGELDPRLRDIWTWICRRIKEEKGKIPKSLHDMWLIPVKNSQIRRLGEGNNSPPRALILEKGEPMADIITALTSQNAVFLPLLVDTTIFTPNALKLLRKTATTIPDLRLACQDQLLGFLNWLVTAKEMLLAASPENIKSLLRHLEKLLRETKTPTQELIGPISRLPIFSKSVPATPFEERVIVRCDLDQSGTLYETPPQLPSIPELRGIGFYTVDAKSAEKFIVRKLSLLKEITIEQVLTQHFLPWMASTKDVAVIPAKEALVKWIFENSTRPSESWMVNIVSQPIVPLQSQNGDRIYRCLKDLVNPTSHYAQLYFDEELVFPCLDFFEQHKTALVACGLSSGIVPTTPLSRASYYSTCGATVQELERKVALLLEIPIDPELSASADSMNKIQAIKWLPGNSVDGQLDLLAPDSCRGLEQSHLVDVSWGTTSYSVRRGWKKFLGWDRPVPKEVLFRQLDHSIERREYEKVDQILAEIELEDISDLAMKPCLLGYNRSYMMPERIFALGSMLKGHSLAPYLDEIDEDFANKHANLLGFIGIAPQPTIADLQYVQNSLPKSDKGQLNEQDLGIAIATLEIATRLQYPPINFLIPDRISIPRMLTDIVHGDPIVNGGIADLNFTHTRISQDLITRLGVENSFAYATRNEINIEDEDDDEYTPVEKLSTVIADTLGRYPVETTFSEFLANADDAGATQISWTVDACGEGSHASDLLLTKELAALQGPALFAYNNGVFSDDDYAGFKDIGQGGKKEDATTTGMFGRGVLSMYHFTDVPMLVSGGFCVILDPQQECLTRNRRWNRKIGIKLPLSIARRVAEDQLAPFYGLHGFSKHCDYYQGTIFRLPFRAASKKTVLKDSPLHMDHVSTSDLLEAYFDTARISLLFLHNVTNIEFLIRGKDLPAWSVTAQRSEDSADDVFQKVTVRSLKQQYEPVVDVWHVGITDIEYSPPGIARLGKGSSKITERGIAACIQQGSLSSSEDKKNDILKIALTDDRAARYSRFGPKIFCRLPITSGLSLPVSIHASFAITGDRKTIPFEDQSDHARWNHWLLTESIPNFYLEFLKDLSPKVGDEAFKFWPSTISAGRFSNLSVTITDAFWIKLMDQEHVDFQMYPMTESRDLSVAGVTDLRRKKERKTRKVHTVTSLSNTRFDFLKESTSSRLRPLFETLHLKLVRPPQRIWKNLRDKAPEGRLVELGPTYLAEVFRQDKNCNLLESFVSQLNSEVDQSGIMALLLELLIPSSTHTAQIQIDILHGCRVLPRPSFSAPFGVLEAAPETKSQYHLVATAEEEELFSFASDYLVNTNLSPALVLKSENDELSRSTRDVIAELVNANINVRKLVIEDLSTILAHPLSPIISAGTSSDRDSWVPRLWTYINRKFQAGWTLFDSMTKDKLISEADLWDQPVYRFSADQQWCYITPRQFEVESCIVEPESDEHKKLCAVIPGLKCLDRTCIPEPLLKEEGQLTDDTSFQRFLRCLKTIEQSTGSATKTTLSSVLSVEAKDALRALLSSFLGDCFKSNVSCDVSMLKQLPVWPRFKHPDHAHLGYIAAEDAFFCTHSKMFMPWIKNLAKFIDPKIVKGAEHFLSKMGCQPMTADLFWSETQGDLPTMLRSEAHIQDYYRLIQYLASREIKPAGNVAPNGRGLMCKASSLYDHSDPIFKAAFRGEESARFLHKVLQLDLESWWTGIGLRARPSNGVMSSEDYLECTLAMDGRWMSNTSDQYFDQDAEIVSAYLSFDRQELRKWPQSTWEQISKARMFKVKEDVSDQQSYRQARMQLLAREHTHCALKDAGRAAYRRLIWSQVKFLEAPAADFVFGKLPNGGLPSTALVFEHLQFLASMCKDVNQRDLEEYLKDIQACYTSLQDAAGIQHLLPGIRNAKIWFNIDATQLDKIMKPQLESSLTTAKLICLNSPVDFKPIRYARKFLTPYESLLTRLGCKSVVQPDVAAPRPIRIQSTPILTEIRKLRDQGVLTDVTFEVNGERKAAHKIFLVAVSEHCKQLFLGEWGRLLKQGAIIEIDYLQFGALSAMIDFAYTGEFVAPVLKNPMDSNEIADALDDMLDLLEGTNLWFIDRLHELTEDYLLSPAISQNWIRVDNVVRVKERAEGLRAPRLVKHCEDLIVANKEIVDAVAASDDE